MYQKTIEELMNDSEPKLVLDIRKEEDYKKDTYPDAINMRFELFDEDKEAYIEKVKNLASGKKVYLLCYTGQRSDEISSELQEEHDIDAYSIEGGFRSYLRVKLSNLLAEPKTPEQITKDIERSIVKKFRKSIWRPFTKAINEYELIKDGDKIACCISGGKDSMLMAKLFQELARHGKKNFEVVFLVMNPGYNPINYETICNNAKLLNVPITVFETEIFDTVAEITRTV